ncbi:MAG TPA: alpha/beta hydrolase, partial [Actinomycetota bacterium]|nr:alpha/beta hydrolase [Actinomycetota bacterium]
IEEPRIEEMDVRGVGGIRLAVRVHEGPATSAPGLLLHHGLASSQRIWDLMVPRLIRRFRVVTYDARGHGLSAKPSSGYGFDPVVADARAVIRAAQLSRPLVAGHSWGGMVALELAARLPRTVAGAVLVDGGIGSLRETMDWPTTKEELAPPHLAGLDVEAFVGMIRSFLGGSLEITSEIEDIVLSVMHVDRRGRIRPRLSRANHFRILRAIWLRDADETLSLLSVPALAVLARGGGDPEWDQRKRRAAARVARSGAPVRISWIEGIHDLPLQHPGALASRIERFSRQLVR